MFGLVSKKKYNKLIEEYNWLVDIKNDWEDSYNQMQSKVVRLEQQCNRLYKELDKADDEVLDLKLERDMYKEEHEKVRQKYIDKDVELQIVDRIVLQYEQRINELEEQLNEIHRKRLKRRYKITLH
ncbi:hypothetical protein LM99_0056 [Enterococcus phage vB_EfaS_LM99]|nr:hypothetical protein LM99_0056 [Enterococcus phage vB_EfaS_LM99]